MSEVVVVRKYKEYRVMAEFNAHRLSTEVEEKLNDGWQLYGLPFTFRDQVCQAMTREREVTT